MKWTPAAALPFSVNLGNGPLTMNTSGGSISGSVTPSGSYTYTWSGRGPGSISFGSPSSASTSVNFSVAGDYVLNLKASNGSVTAGNSIIVHVQ